MKIIGLRIEKYIGKQVTGHNPDFEYNDAEFEKHIICTILSNGKKVEIELSTSEGICGSGWTTASYGHITITPVNRFNGFTYLPKKPLEIEDIDLNFKLNDFISNDVFSVYEYGRDTYYPSVCHYVNMNLFNETIRHKKNRPVWIFLGKSNSGKSFISSKIKDLKVYETDSSNTLPEKITESIVVLGNKYQYTVEDIKSRLFGNVDVQIVEFK